MARRTNTRQRMIDTAGRLFQRQGYHATGLNQVLAESGAPKGSLYFHFPAGKDQLAAESVARSGGKLGERMAAMVAAAPDGPAAIVALGELFAASLLASGFREGCPVATVALEAAADNDQIHAACDGVYGAWLAGLTERLDGWGVPADRAAAVADLVLSGIQGALLLARVRKDTGVVTTVAGQLADLVGREAAGHEEAS
jgi:TetR/AcrR family transcriptional repressor of lmrAB and yxaGH operons